MEIIRVEGLSKKYKLGVYGGKTLSEDLKRWLSRKKNDGIIEVSSHSKLVGSRTEEGNFWALRDINFSVNQGEVLGIIGKNGAGKSTLLKLLSRITSPTHGEIKIKGRIAALLEVGTGFHPELTGRENIFLNGAILGMTRFEVASKLDQIIDFSGIEHHIDTPVKRYSSGMKVRLGFAVAAHLEPEILIVDEVLAVGDAEFQKKCIGKMQDVAGNGRTVLFVSHNMNAVNRLCTRAILLEDGFVSYSGETQNVVRRYLDFDKDAYAYSFVNSKDQSDKEIALLDASLVDQGGNLLNSDIDVMDAFYLEFHIFLKRNIRSPHITFHFKNQNDEFVFFSDRRDDPESVLPTEAGKYKIKIKVPQPLLKPDIYTLSIGITNLDTTQTNHFPSILKFQILDIRTPRPSRAGYIFVPLKWDISKLND